MREYVLVSSFVTNSEKLKRLEEQWAKRDKEHKTYLGRSTRQLKEINPEEFGGEVLLVDPYNLKKGFIKRFQCHLATGLMYVKEKKCLFVGSFGTIKKIINGSIVGEIKNNLFNDVHFIDSFKDSYLLVSSTGTDSLIEIDLNKDTKTWDWLGTENGYSTSPSGKIIKIDRKKDYRKIDTITPEHTTHINSAIYINGKEEILATLFHQGELILINKNVPGCKILLSGLKCPHHIRKTKAGYILSNTLEGEVIFLDKKFNIIKKMRGEFNWLQDAIELNDNSLLVIDSNNYRICRLSCDGKILEELSFKEKPLKLFCFLKIDYKFIKNIF